MSDTIASVPKAAGALTEDHRRVDGLVARLRSVREPSALVAALEALDKVLVAHFVHEESPGGIYDVLGVPVPEYRAPLGDLVDEHYQILTELRGLVARGMELLQGLQQLQVEARTLADRLAAHETREDQMASSAETRGH